ncbi:MAG TPA: hypothetical protein VMK31_05560 [Sphingomicrobium sp.]|nr:hypothetical protein [Sphingomicrobium sp.]
MKAVRLFLQLVIYYLVVGGAIFLTLTLFPYLQDYLPVGGVETLITQEARGPFEGVPVHAQNVDSLGESIIWLGIALAGALLTSIPVSMVYMGIRHGDEYDQSLISTVLILPLVVTGIVVIVQNSLALAFSLAGIAGAVRFKNSLKSSGDALFILAAIGIGLSAGIGAVELSAVMSVVFNFAFLALWVTEYGERPGMKRYMSDYDGNDPAGPAPLPPAGAAPLPPQQPPPPAA